MKYLKQIDRAIKYIETHLKEEISLKEVSSYSGYSLYHFQRIFKSGFGDSLGDYIRKRRITEAGYDLINSDDSILSIAIDYCYESQEAFSRAFLKLYNQTPGEFRKKGLFYPIRKKIDMEYISFEISRRADGMSPRIKFMDDIYVAGKRKTIHGPDNYYKEIPLFWQNWCNEQYSDEITGSIDKTRIAGICIPVNDNSLDYMIGHMVDSGHPVTQNYELLKIPSAKYAVFTSTGPLTESVQKTWDYIWGTWLISSGHTHSGKPEIEIYYCKDGKNYADICIPII